MKLVGGLQKIQRGLRTLTAVTFLSDFASYAVRGDTATVVSAAAGATAMT